MPEFVGKHSTPSRWRPKESDDGNRVWDNPLELRDALTETAHLHAVHLNGVIEREKLKVFR